MSCNCNDTHSIEQFCLGILAFIGILKIAEHFTALTLSFDVMAYLGAAAVITLLGIGCWRIITKLLR